MSENLSFNNAENSASLHGDLTIYEVEQLKSELSNLATEDAPKVIDCSELGNVDSAGLQLLVALKSHLESMGNGCKFINPSDALMKSASLYRMDRELFEAALAG